jgi:putative tricarboxylic transport membrane protein
VTSLVWTAIGVAILVASTTLRVGTWSNPGPGFLPLITGVIIGALGVSVSVQEWSRRRRTGQGLLVLPPGLNLPVVGLALAALFAYALLLERIGYLLVTFLFLTLMLRFMGALRWGPVLATAILSTVGSYVLFSVWLRVPLPPWPGF